LDPVFNKVYFGRKERVFLPLNGVIFLIQDTLWCFLAEKWAVLFVQNQFTDRTRAEKSTGIFSKNNIAQFLTLNNVMKARKS